MPASPTTATPTGASRSTPRAGVVDGDQIMGVLALALADRGALAANTLVTTVMSNLGLTHRDAGGRHHDRPDRGG